MEVQQRKKYPTWAEEQRKKAVELARVRAIREKKMDRNKKEVGKCLLPAWRARHTVLHDTVESRRVCSLIMRGSR